MAHVIWLVVVLVLLSTALLAVGFGASPLWWIALDVIGIAILVFEVTRARHDAQT